jgi:SAM-dependent methyltransferase
MVHALRQAHRVLKPGGLLIDLLPAPAHRRVGIVSGGHYRRLGTTRETLDLDRAAERAVRRVGLFRLETGVRFDCRRVMSRDTWKARSPTGELTAWTALGTVVSVRSYKTNGQ